MFNLYLKSLEIQGFKSFPTATRLAFEKPITAIVGPNGSGKSNISDAILWVMGEQSTKTLRGGKMEDVIFGGTQRRSQLGFAEVSLILDNSEGHISLDTTEVMLTRRYYRSGESEYYINQSLVRLKDVVDILMDTGLGREGYSVIGQGRISDILSTKSKDRREIFEEAAGISRYRHRKDESERKLQQAEDNLVRIGDIIGELEEHVEPLREQSEVAKKYLLLTAEQQGIQVSLWLRELETLKSRIEKNDADYAEATRKYDTSKIELDDSNIESDSLAEMTKDTDIEADRVRDLIQNTEVQSSEVDSRIAVLKTQLESNNSQIENLSTEIKNQDAHSDGVGDEITIEEDRLKEIADEKAKINQNIETLRNELQNIIDSSGVSTEKHSTLINQEQNLQAEHNDKRSEFTALASQAQEITDMETSVEKELAVAKEDFKEHEKDHKSLVKELDKSKEELTSLGNVLNGLTLKAENRAKKAKESGEKLERLTYELNTLKSTQNILQEMEKEFKGYSGSVKMVMQEFSRGALKNIHGTVGSLVKTEDEYTIAIETALGGALQNIVVDTVDDGKAAINYLKR
ncbi:MAG: AAA family ATPase, partial [Oscillospiraceae bacterium]|nr:AAA family ATPase [Oscillospiraceae bacterium]